jgi:hypothetical protein
MLKRNRGLLSRILFFGFIGFALLLFSTTPAMSQQTTQAETVRWYLYLNDQLVAGTNVPAEQFKLDIEDDGRFEPLNIKILAGTGPQKVYIHDYYMIVELIEGTGLTIRYPQEGNYPIKRLFPANAPDTVINDQNLRILATAEELGYDLPDPIYTGFLKLTIFIRYRVGGPPPGAATQTLESSALTLGEEYKTQQQVDAEGYTVAQDDVQVNVQDWYVTEDSERRDTTSGERLQDQLSTPAGQATVGVTAVAGISLVALGLQAGGVFPSFMSGVPSAAALGPGSIFGTTGTLQSFATGKLSSEARNRILSKIARAIKNKVRRMANCPNCSAKWSAPEICPGCGLLTADLIQEYRNALKSSSTKALGILAEAKKNAVSKLTSALGTGQKEAADVMTILTEAGLLNFGVAAAGTGAATAAGLTIGIAVPQWLNITGTYALNLYFMIGLAAVMVIVPLVWTKRQKKKQREKYAMEEVEEVPGELPEDAEDIAKMEEEFKKVPPKETKASSKKTSKQPPAEEE